MPKIMDGCLISCEKTICLFIQNLDKEHQNQIIKKKLDDTHLLIRQDKLSFVQEKVYEMQDTHINKEIKIHKKDIY
jgi:hypothetical protein